ncbi:MAG TPA: protein kinase [Thermoanaerobaculia bacterium]|nr:protein kinase [Thermoanaerobaculia bacterium]HUM30350.1 protein kinase [Thermoanaerobaculia bacterium]HXK68499.1 protein kinase [Thermoanaerobaculia bacterium]
MDIRLCPKCETVHGGGTSCPSCSSGLVLQDESFFLGKFVGKYLIDRLLGAGGMGVVFRAIHTTLKRPAALKIILPELSDEGFLQRFQREAQLLADLKHPNIVEIYDFDVSPWGPPFYVMEYLEGKSLRRVLSDGSSPIPYPEACSILQDLSSALQYAHRKGVIHRDLKPENIMLIPLEDRTVVKILDFGIAKILTRAREEASILTQTGAVLGTPQYMAPEQVMGGEVGPATDQYALALITAEMLTGKALRAGKTLGEIISREFTTPLPLETLSKEDLPPGAGEALRRATQPDPSLRFEDVTSYMRAFCAEHVSAGEGATSVVRRDTEATPTISVPSHPFPSAKKRRRFPFVPVGILILILALSSILFLVRPWSRTSTEPAELLTLLDTIALPPDTVSILGSGEGAILLKGSGCVYLLDPSNPAIPGRFPLMEGEQILGRLRDGRLATREGETVWARDLQQNERKPLFEDLESGKNLRINTDGTWLALFDSENVTLLSSGETKPVRFAPGDGEILEVTVGSRYAAMVSRLGSVTLIDLHSGSPVFRAPYPESEVKTLALQEAFGLVAVGGWYDTLFLGRAGENRLFPVLTTPGMTRHIQILPDHPTLVAAKGDTLTLYRPENPTPTMLNFEGRDVLDAAMVAEGLAIVVARPLQMFLYRYRDLSIATTISTGPKEIWALATGEKDSTIYAGNSEGTLFRVNPEHGDIETHPLHTQGITSMVAGGAYLASASDDKTIAVWKIPEMNVIWRSRVHDYLINFLFLNSHTSTLWSSSSDGTVKAWRWPGLEDAGSFPIERISSAALWVNREENKALLGTWDHRALLLERTEGSWKVIATYALPSSGGYSIAALEDRGLILLVGVNPTGLFLLDARDNQFFSLDPMGLTLFWTTPYDQDSLLVGGENVLGLLSFTRGDSEISCKSAIRFSTDLHTLFIVLNSQPASQIIAGSGKGEIHILDLTDQNIPFAATDLHPRLLTPLKRSGQ